MSKRRLPPPDRLVGVAAIMAAFPGWMAGMYLGIVYLIGRTPLGPRERDLMVVFAAVCVGSLSGCAAVWVREVQVALSVLGVSRADAVRGIGLGDLLLSAVALAVWSATGYDRLPLLAPPVGVGLGAWAAARRVWPFATSGTVLVRADGRTR